VYDDPFHVATAFIALSNRIAHVTGLKNATYNITQGTSPDDVGLGFVSSDEMRRHAVFKLNIPFFQPALPGFY
jgi:hypothetical protein